MTPSFCPRGGVTPPSLIKRKYSDREKYGSLVSVSTYNVLSSSLKNTTRFPSEDPKQNNIPSRPRSSSCRDPPNCRRASDKLRSCQSFLQLIWLRNNFCFLIHTYITQVWTEVFLCCEGAWWYTFEGGSRGGVLPSPSGRYDGACMHTIHSGTPQQTFSFHLRNTLYNVMQIV